MIPYHQLLLLLLFDAVLDGGLFGGAKGKTKKNEKHVSRERAKRPAGAVQTDDNVRRER